MRSDCVVVAIMNPDRLRRIGRRFKQNACCGIVSAKVAQLDRRIVTIIGFEKKSIALRADFKIDN